jgi:short-subunit dehydrogenase
MSEVVVVTGASAGVGRAVVREFARRQARVALIARGLERIEEARHDVERAGGRAVAISADVADAGQVAHAAERAERELGPIDIWINNAMTTVLAPFCEITPEEFKRATEVTSLGFVFGTMTALQRMKKRNRGTIVQIGSALAYRSIPLQSAYCGAKHAIVGFTDSIRCELIHEKSAVHLTIVHLPGMNTPQFSWCRSKLPRQPQPVPPIFEPEVAAEAVYWAAHHRKRELYVGLPTAKAIYGQQIAPGLADRYLARTAFESQQTDTPLPPGRPDNLFEPVNAHWAAHGVFGARAKSSSSAAWFDMHRSAASAVLGGLGLLALGILRARTR